MRIPLPPKRAILIDPRYSFYALDARDILYCCLSGQTSEDHALIQRPDYSIAAGRAEKMRWYRPAGFQTSQVLYAALRPLTAQANSSRCSQMVPEAVDAASCLL